jgi:hypothetical protein
VRPPGFVWDATLRMGPFPLVRARDMYREGAGNVLIRVVGLYPIADVVGPQMDQGSMMRYLSEMIWFPTAFLGDNVSFEPVDDRSARVTLTDTRRAARVLRLPRRALDPPAHHEPDRVQLRHRPAAAAGHQGTRSRAAGVAMAYKLIESA